MLGTYKDAEVAADAFFAVQDGSAVLSHADGLVAAVSTGNGTSAAADAFVAVEFGEDQGVALQDIRRFTDIIQSDAHDLADIVQFFLGEIIIQAGFEVINNAVAELHDGRCDLHGAEI